MSILNSVRDALAALDEHVYYGSAALHPKDALWNYTVFSRRALRPTGGKAAYTDLIEVSVVREEYIPDGLAEKVIEAVCAVPGVKLLAQDAAYDYMVKPSTSVTVEALTLTFSWSRKR